MPDVNEFPLHLSATPVAVELAHPSVNLRSEPIISDQATSSTQTGHYADLLADLDHLLNDNEPFNAAVVIVPTSADPSDKYDE